jgi:hypothetical protein
MQCKSLLFKQIGAAGWIISETPEREPGGESSGSIGEAATRSVPSKGGQEDLHTENGW